MPPDLLLTPNAVYAVLKSLVSLVFNHSFICLEVIDMFLALLLLCTDFEEIYAQLPISSEVDMVPGIFRIICHHCRMVQVYILSYHVICWYPE